MLQVDGRRGRAAGDDRNLRPAIQGAGTLDNFDGRSRLAQLARPTTDVPDRPSGGEQTVSLVTRIVTMSVSLSRMMRTVVLVVRVCVRSPSVRG